MEIWIENGFMQQKRWAVVIGRRAGIFKDFGGFSGGKGGASDKVWKGNKKGTSRPC